MSSERVITVRQLGKCYQIYDQPVDRLKEALSLRRKRYSREFWALRDVTFDVEPGQTVGILGRNGSGKSTLLQLVAGTLTPTCGEVMVNGRIAALLELGAGFVPDFTGRENVYVYGTIMGLSRREIDDRFDQIAAFADIGEFLDQPVKIYSSGMYVRLAFSAAINVDPDVFIVDEALAVGDTRFQHRCMNRIRQFREAGVSILLVSHNSEIIKCICDHAFVLDKGRIVREGKSVHMANWYLAFMTNDWDLQKTLEMERAADQEQPTPLKSAPDLLEPPAVIVEPKEPPLPTPSLANTAPSSAVEFPSSPSQLSDPINEPPAPPAIEVQYSLDRAQYPEFTFFRHGDGKARIVSACLMDENGQPTEICFLGRKLQYCFVVEFYQTLDFHIVGMHVRDKRGTDIIAINSYQDHIEVPPVKPGDRVAYTYSFVVDLKPGDYSICNTVAYDQLTMAWMDWVDNLVIFRVVDPDPDRMIFGAYYPRQVQLQVSCRKSKQQTSFSEPPERI